MKYTTQWDRQKASFAQKRATEIYYKLTMGFIITYFISQIIRLIF